ncbi:MAG: hypothetical protein A4E66_01843 [Syntrophus sp. PtaB.Bin001]|nr:MAG: hypothetical protein A4E66_01843 [Syntrophus sp. PtaB.Bin001]
MAALGAHPYPFQFPLQGFLPLRLLFLLVSQPILLLLQPGRVVSLPGDSLTPVQFQNPFSNVVQKVAIVSDGDDRSRIVFQMVLQPGHGFGVQMVGGLVEEQDVRLLQEEAAKRHPPPLAAGENFYGRVSRRAAQGIHSHFQASVEVPGIQSVQLLLDFRLPFAKAGHFLVVHGLGELLTDPVVFRQEVHRFLNALFHNLPNGQAVVQLWLLFQKTDGISRRGDRLAVVRTIDPGEDTQQGTLPRAVQSEDADLGAVKIGQGDVLQNRFLVVNLGDSDHGVNYFVWIIAHERIPSSCEILLGLHHIYKMMGRNATNLICGILKLGAEIHGRPVNGQSQAGVNQFAASGIEGVIDQLKIREGNVDTG